MTVAQLTWLGGQVPNESHSPFEAEALRAADAQLAAAINTELDGLPPQKEIRAQVLMPAAEKLTIRLVPIDALERLRDAESDRAVVDAFLWCISGALVAQLLAWFAASEPPTAAGIAIAVALTFGVIVSLLFRLRFGRRAKRIRDDFYSKGNQ